jgi:hypothetical protein
MIHFDSWEDQMNHLFSKFIDLLTQCPSRLKKTFKNLNLSEEAQKPDLEIFQQKVKTLKSVNHRMKLIQILASFGNTINQNEGKILIDLDSINHKTASALIQYQKEVPLKTRDWKTK